MYRLALILFLFGTSMGLADSIKLSTNIESEEEISSRTTVSYNFTELPYNLSAQIKYVYKTGDYYGDQEKITTRISYNTKWNDIRIDADHYFEDQKTTLSLSRKWEF